MSWPAAFFVFLTAAAWTGIIGSYFGSCPYKGSEFMVMAMIAAWAVHMNMWLTVR
jgi:hypothetical protein